MRRELWITHETIYDFDRAIDGATITARLRPIETAAQAVLESEVHCHPWPVERSHRSDAGRGSIDRFVLDGPLRRIEVRGQTRLLWSPQAGEPPARRPAADGAGPDEPPGAVPAWARADGAIWRWARRTLPDRAPDAGEIAAFLEMIRSEFTFDPKAADVTTAVPRFFAVRRGVCQDYARLAAGCLAARGVPVRLVFGYLIREPDGGPRFEEGQPHAWLSAWSPQAGWRDADPTTGLAPPAHHVTLRRGRRLRDIQPVSGRLRTDGAAQRLSVRVTVVKDTGSP